MQSYGREAVLDPSEVIAGGAEHLRHRLEALSIEHLRDVARVERTMDADACSRATKDELVAAIVAQALGRA
jgi:hypothetical protein